MQGYWDRHPGQHAFIQIVREGQWITHLFEWIFTMISRVAGYAMTFAIGYLIYYAIEYKHSLDVVIAHPSFADSLASLSNVIINVGPELVFPGTVALCIRAFQARRKLDGWLYLITTGFFVILTMVLLNAYMSGGITKDFLSAMLFWRAFAALWYTAVAAYCGGHGGLDFKTLFAELDTLRGQLDSGQKAVSTVQQQLDTERKRVSNLQQQLDTEKQRARLEVDTLRGQMNIKQQEAESLRAALCDGQGFQSSRVSSLQQEVERVQATADAMRRELHMSKSELERVQLALSNEQQVVSSLRKELSSVQRQVSSQSVQPLAKRVSSGQAKVVQLDSHRRDQDDVEKQIRELHKGTPVQSLSARAIAGQVGCSPTTAAKWKAIIESEEQAAVNE